VRGGVAGALALLLALPGAAAGHTWVTPDQLARAWNLDPWVVTPLLVGLGLYLRGLSRLWGRAGRGSGVSVRQAAAFCGGWLVLAAALVSPLHAAGGALFSLHMLQHVLMMLVAAPLLVLGRPLTATLWAFSAPARRRLGGVARAGPVHALTAALRRPLVAWGVHATVLWAWHVPALYQATLRSELIHFLQHASFMAGALVFWWAAVDLVRRPVPRYGIGVLSVFTTAVHGAVLGALLTFSLVLWYPAYAVSAAAWGMPPLEDQQLGGLIMWIPAGVVYLGAMLWLLALGLQAREHPALSRRAALLPGGGSALGIACAALLLAGCSDRMDSPAVRVAGGDPERAPQLFRSYGCTACHSIPGVRGPDAWVGPPLTSWSKRSFIGGVIANEPENLVRWIVDPPSINPLTAMPVTGASVDEARHMAAYLMRLR
jgi:putative membrane protein